MYVSISSNSIKRQIKILFRKLTNIFIALLSLNLMQIIDSSSKNLPKIYPKFTQNLPKIRAFLVFYLPKTYQRFTLWKNLLSKHLPGSRPKKILSTFRFIWNLLQDLTELHWTMTISYITRKEQKKGKSHLGIISA